MGGSSKKQTVGYKYYLGMHLILCHGPVDKLTRIRWDNKTAWTGRSYGGDIQVNANALFGGETREGGVEGRLQFETGGPDQGQNSYLVGRLGELVPSFRGVAGIVLNQMYLGMNPYLKRPGFRVTRIYKRQDGIEQWYPEKAGIPSANVTRAEVVDLDATVQAGGDVESGMLAGVRLTDFGPADITTVTPYLGNPITLNLFGQTFTIGLPRYVAWSPWGQPVMSGPMTGTVYHFQVVTDDDPDTDQNYSASGSPFNGYEAARAAFLAEYPDPIQLPAGASSYTFYIKDTPLDDNTGGVSLLVQVHEPEDMNPAHIIRECLTDPDWGMGYLDEDIDDDSFKAAADTLFDEQMGMSLLWDRQIPIEDFIKEVLKHIDGVCYVDRRTGKFVLKLIRDDYDEESLLVLNEDNVDKVEDYSQPKFGELVTSISVVYWDTVTNTKASVAIQDIALERMQRANINTTVQYPGFTNARIATRVAQRDLRVLSAQGITCTVYADRTAKDLNPGDVFKLNWPDHQMENVVMRVVGIAYGNGRSNQIRITCTQDVFSLPAGSFVAVPDVQWEDPDAPPEPSPHRLAFEMPYAEMIQRDSQSSVDNSLLTHPEIGYAAVAAASPGGSAINARLFTDSGAGYEEAGTVDFTPIALLADDLPQEAGPSTVEIEDGVDLGSVQVGTWAQVDDEIMEVQALTVDSVTLGRGCLDTTPAPHDAGSPIFFWDASAAADPKEYVASDSVDLRVLPVTGRGPLDLGDAPTDTVEIVGRPARPYPPGKLIVDGSAYPSEVTFTFDISWAHRNRLTQADQLVDTTEGDVSPEEGTTYTVRLYLDDVLMDTITDIEDNFLEEVAITGNGRARVEVWSVRDGLESFQPIWCEFEYIGQLLLTDDIPDWSMGVPFSHTAQIQGGLPPITWSITAGALPAGLSLNASTGEISGTPVVAGVASFTLRATDANAIFDEIEVSQEIFTDAMFEDVLLLLDPTGEADGTAGIVDLSPASRALTRVGSAQILDEHLELDGNDDWVTAADSDDWRFYSGSANYDFTIELFGVVFDSQAVDVNGGLQALITQYDAFSPATNQRAWYLVASAANLSFGISTGGTTVSFSLSTPWVPVIGQAYDIAVVRQGSNYYLFIDGVLMNSTSNSGVIFDSSSPLAIGGRNPRSGSSANSDDFDGRMRAVRITRGARYTSNYTVPIVPLPRPRVIEGEVVGTAINETYSAQLTTVAGWGTGPYTWSVSSGALPTGLSLNSSTGQISGVVPVGTAEGNYSFEVTVTDSLAASASRSFVMGVGHYIVMMPLTGANGGTTFTDKSGKAWTASGNVQTVTDAGAIGGSAATFDGSGDYLSTPDHVDFALGTADFTLETFFKMSALPAAGFYPGMISQRTNNVVQHAFTLAVLASNFGSGMSNEVYFQYSSSGTSAPVLGSAVPPIGEYVHVAVSRRGAMLYTHINGVPCRSVNIGASFSMFDSNQAIRIGAVDIPPTASSYWNGQLAELRWMRGAARYAERETFTPPTAPSDFPVV